ncbi:odorant-binding protein 2b-like [Elephas maximus indicus]|uniref:odorant-binding protein 2b-like n=1 Tax=Elephas maximus indicus TaxID=99487 RepID=UPI00211685DB|nr:odorant-binding protein 2b-like [Elephas maximus indicus]
MDTDSEYNDDEEARSVSWGAAGEGEELAMAGGWEGRWPTSPSSVPTSLEDPSLGIKASCAGAGSAIPAPITGTWYVKAMVANKNLPLEKRPKKVSPLTVTALEGGDLEASFTFLKKDQCHEKRIVMERVGDPGKYIAKGGKKHIYLQELPVKDHYIILFECQHDERTFHMGKLLGRSLDMNVEALEEFRKFTQRKGFQQENIITPAQMENCIPESE